MARPISLDIGLCNEAIMARNDNTIWCKTKTNDFVLHFCRIRGVDDDDDGVHELIERAMWKNYHAFSYPQSSIYEMFNVLTLTIHLLAWCLLLKAKHN